ncbi:unnamed protein product [Timema podura]|uniref:Tetraspanin n=2 Tax=Timema TaxID=61471 RepID=A0ABN7NU51_TIMPD|nr:unnamed protein product [Timema podura]
MDSKTMAPQPVDLNKGMRCIKYLLFSFNFMFMLTGILIIAIGTTILAIYQKYDQFLEDKFYSPATLLIVVGVIIGLVAFFGCCGAAKESTCMIMVFSVFLGIIFILEISAGIAAYVMQDGLRDVLEGRMRTMMSQYSTDSQLQCCGLESLTDWEGVTVEDEEPDYTQLPSSCCAQYGTGNQTGSCKLLYGNGCLARVEFILSESTVMLASAAFTLALLQLQCCGLESLTDWEGVTVEDEEPDYTQLPSSCCAQYGTGNQTGSCKLLYGNGCLARVEFILSESTVMLASAAFTLALLQLLGVVFACSLGRSIRYQKTWRERRRWELRERLVNSYTPIGQTDPKTTYPVIFMSGSKEADC